MSKVFMVIMHLDRGEDITAEELEKIINYNSSLYDSCAEVKEVV